MTEHFTICVLLIAFVWFVLSFYYQQAIRPFLCDCARFGVFAVRDKMRSLAITDPAVTESTAYGLLEKMLNNMVHACSWFSFGVLVEYLVIYGDDDGPKELKRFESEASRELKSLGDEAIWNMTTAMVANSPGWFTIAMALGSVVHARVWIQKRLESWSRFFWHDDHAMMLHAR